MLTRRRMHFCICNFIVLHENGYTLYSIYEYVVDNYNEIKTELLLSDKGILTFIRKCFQMLKCISVTFFIVHNYAYRKNKVWVFDIFVYKLNK